MNYEDEVPKARFTGIFIPAELMEIEELSMLELMLLSWIDALHSEKRGGCFAKNEYLAKKLRVKENTVAKALVHLRDLHLLEQVSFDGRNRVIRSKVDEYKVFVKTHSQSNAGLDLNPMQGWIKIQGSIGFLSQAEKSIPKENSEPHTLYESKEEIKEEKNTNTPREARSAKAAGVCVSSSSKKVREAYGDFVKLKAEEYAALCEEHGESTIKSLIDEMNDYCAASRPKGYSDYAAAIRQWIRRRKDTKNHHNRAPYETTQRRISRENTEKWIKHNGNPNDNPNIMRFT